MGEPQDRNFGHNDKLWFKCFVFTLNTTKHSTNNLTKKYFSWHVSWADKEKQNKTARGGRL